jgi:peptidyl-prolyl cis-trans isomerase SurA
MMFETTAAAARRAGRTLALSLLLASAMALPAAHAAAPAAKPAAAEPLAGSRIVAVVNGDAITSADVENRARLFAVSTGLAPSPEVIARLKRQMLRQLVDERLRMQEAQRLKVVIEDKQIAEAIREIEQRNGMPGGTLRRKLEADGVSMRTLIDQVRTQLAWVAVLRQQLADKLAVSDSDIDAQLQIYIQQTGKAEYRVGEIFIPVDDPANTADSQRFAETVIKELRAGAPFPLVAAQFSQTQTALEGGELGWVQLNQLDPAVARLVTEMPPGAVSNPVRVPGGFSIVTLQGKREIGRDPATIMHLRQAFLPFTAPLNPAAPTDQQRQTLEKAKQMSGSVRGCEAVEKLNMTSPEHPIDPGDVRLEGINPPSFRQLLANLPIGTLSQPLVSQDGITLVVVCSREERNLATPSRQAIQSQLINDRVEMFSRQMLRDLRRQGSIEMRDGNA